MIATAPINTFYFDSVYLQTLAEKRAVAYSSASPFPHAVIDNFLPEPTVLEKVLEEFPAKDDADWKNFGNSPAQQGKITQAKDELFGPCTRQLVQQFNSGTFIRFLEHLTGIKGLIPDPHYLGGGLHQTFRGGFLKIHTDFSWYPELKLRRRLNVLLYLNQDWKEEYGGHVELWDKQMSNCVVKALPLFNRCVVFSTDRFSYHGHPDPLNCPPDRSRKSLAFYYYTADGEEALKKHGTLFTNRPGEKISYFRNFLARCVPPILYDAVIRLEQQLKGSKRI